MGLDNRDLDKGVPRFVRFVMWKRNLETMGAIKNLARAIGTKEKFFGVSGNKDKRAVTTQRISTFSNHWNALARVDLGENLRIGNLEYSEEEVKMGSHSGNQFLIILRGIQQEMTQSLLSSRIDQLHRIGFLNYFGLQRFGSANDTGTHRIGLAMLKQDYEQAVKLILGLRDDRGTEEAQARARYMATGDVQQAIRDFRGHVRTR